MMRDFPVGVRLYDMLFDRHEDVRPLPFDARRERLEALVRAASPDADGPVGADRRHQPR